jgi:hypothetical protein
MKKLILLLLFIPLVSFGQDFRKMNFGDSIERLVEMHPDVEFTVGEEMGTEVLYHNDIVSGINTKVAFIFMDKKLELAGYIFNEDKLISSDERLKNYKNISERLNRKYDMVNEDEWHNTRYKNQPNSYARALSMEYVDFKETYLDENVSIVHSLGTQEGDLVHSVFYTSADFHKYLQESADDDF